MISSDVVIGRDVIVYHPELVNLYSCTIGDGCKIASFVEIQSGVTIGKNCKIEAFSFIPTGVTIGDGCFIGPHTCFTNDRFPRAVGFDGELLGFGEWQVVPTYVGDRVSIGANATIVCGVRLHDDSFVAAGSVVTHDVERGRRVCGVPARDMDL